MVLKQTPLPGVAQATPVGSLNVAATCTATTALGPGLRSVVWVQGCPFRCKGCVAPDWIPFRPASSYQPEELGRHLLHNPKVTGITISGGEPMLQAALLAQMLTYAKKDRDIDVIVYSGFQYKQLLSNKNNQGITALLSQIDVLIEGPYIESRNDNRGMRGSSNQSIIHLTDRLKGFDFENQSRTTELLIQHGQVLVVGVPQIELLTTLDMVMQRPVRGADYVRS
jgi:anaerobic ribonucleoside-triphosphate reductase activating protein